MMAVILFGYRPFQTSSMITNTEYAVSQLYKWHYFKYGASQVALVVKNLPAKQETQVQSLGWEDPLEKEMATHSSNLAYRIP